MPKRVFTVKLIDIRTHSNTVNLSIIILKLKVETLQTGSSHLATKLLQQVTPLTREHYWAYNINSPGPEIAWACLKLHTLRVTVIFRNGRFFCRCFCRFRQCKTKYKFLKKVLLSLTITLFTTPLFLISGYVLLRCVFVLLRVMLVTKVMSSFVLCVH